MTPERLKFDDPRLKAVVQRAWGAETAPPELRQRVAELIAKETAGQAGGSEPAGPAVIRRPARSFWLRRVTFGAAAAAAVLALGVGVAFLNRTNSGNGEVATAAQQAAPAAEPVAPAALPAELGQQLVRGHDLCVRVHSDEHHLLKDAPKDDYTAIAQELEGKAKYPVIAKPVGGDWAFHGASMCPVGKMRVPHLMYTHGDAFLSVYSLPAASAPTILNRQSCDGDVNGRAVAGFVEGKTFYAVLASSKGTTPVGVDDVRAVRDQLRDDAVASRTSRGMILLAALAR